MGTQQVGRRVAGVLAAAVALGGLAVAPASATGTTEEDVCAVQAYVPGHKVSIDAPLKDVVVTLLDDCDRTGAADVDIKGPYGSGSSVYFRPDQSQAVWGISDEYPPGTYRFVAGPGSDVEVTRVDVVLKYGARASLRGSRSGDDVTLRVQASYYDASKFSYQPLRDRRATIEILGKDGRTWQYLRSVTVPRSGLVDHTFTNRYAATYRVTTWETHNIFSRTSRAVTVPGR